VAVSKVFYLRESVQDWFNTLTLSFGMDLGFLRETLRPVDFVGDDDVVRPFGSVAFRIAQPVSLIVDWRSGLSVGLSIAPFRDFSLTVNPTLFDVTAHGSKEDRAFIMTVVWSEYFT